VANAIAAMKANTPTASQSSQDANWIAFDGKRRAVTPA
jgi:hypothetical protein